MSPAASIILTTIIAGGVSASLFASCSYIIFLQTIGAAFSGSSFKNYSFSQATVFIACRIGVVVSILIPSFTAFYINPLVLEVSPQFSVHLVIFGLILAFPAFLVVVAYFSIGTYQKISQQRRREKLVQNNELHQNILDGLKNAGIEVIAINTQIIGYEGPLAVAVITLQVRNIPSIISEFNISLLPTKNEQGIICRLHDFPNGHNHIGSLKAKNENGTWVFYKDFTNQVISNDSGKISFQIEIAAPDLADSQLATTITLQLTTWRDEKGYWKNSSFWRETIPITIRRPNP